MQATHLNRTQIYLTAAQQKILGTMAQQQGSSSSALIRIAIDGYIQAHKPATKQALRMAAAGTPTRPACAACARKSARFEHHAAAACAAG
jgi:hypothetical protein